MAQFSVREDQQTDAKDERRLRVMRDREQSARAQREEEYESQAQAVPVVSRKTFIQKFGREYTPSHVTFIGPTQRGKTTLCFELLAAVKRYHPEASMVMLHGKVKGRDHTMDEYAKRDNYRIVRNYPPGMTLRPKHWKRNVNGYILRPLRKDDISAAEEEKLLQTEYKRAIRKNYHFTGGRQKKSYKITVVDERAQADKDLKLGKELDAPLQRGLPHNPEWNSIQRGAWVSYHCYDAPEHIFLFKSDDGSNEERYAEFGCAEPKVVIRILNTLKLKKVPTGGTISQCLYMRRSDRYMCIVDT